MTDRDIAEARSILAERRGAVGWLRIHNPSRLNAMSMSMWSQLAERVGELDADPDIRVIVLAGDGTEAFCAGGDISEFTRLRSGDVAAAYDAAGTAAMAALHGTAKPTIAMIEGFCIGGGLGLALQCDLRLAADTARLGIPAARRGIAYPLHGVRQLVDLVGPADAMNLLCTGRQFGAADALAMGLLNEVHPAAAIVEAVTSLAETIASNAPLSVRAAKTMVRQALLDPAERDLAACAAAEAECLASEDYQEATRAFTEKRRPIFRGC